MYTLIILFVIWGLYSCIHVYKRSHEEGLSFDVGKADNFLLALGAIVVPFIAILIGTVYVTFLILTYLP